MLEPSRWLRSFPASAVPRACCDADVHRRPEIRRLQRRRRRRACKQVAERVMRTRREGHDVVVVVSAMGDTTDELLALAKQVSPNPDRRELDMLLTAGERISMALLSMAIRELGGDADQLHRQPVGHHHQRSPRRRAHHRGASVPRPGRARARQDRRHRRLSGRVVPPRGDDARPRRQRHDRGRDGGRARRRRTARSARTSTACTRPTRASCRRRGASARCRTRRRRRWPSRARRC